MKAVFVAILLLTTPTVAAENLSCRELFGLVTGMLMPPVKGVPMFSLMYLPGKKLASAPGIEIAGFLKNAGTFREVAEKLAQRVERFDRDMESLGFVVPESSRIVLFNKASFSVLPRMRSIYSVRFPIFNVWKRRQQRLIVVDPPNPDYLHELLYSADVVLHERSHDFLLYTYGRGGLVVENKTINEALADFFAIHALDDPQVGRYTYRDISPLRDIDKRVTDTKFGMKVLSGADDIQKGDYHANSVFFSHILWEVRKRLGVEETTKILKPFVDNLNLYRQSFEHWYPEFARSKHLELKFRGDLLYFLAVLNKTVNGAEINQVIAEVVKEWGFNLGEIKNISRYMKQNGEITGLNLALERKISTNFAIINTESLVLRNGGAILFLLGGWKIATWMFDKSE